MTITTTPAKIKAINGSTLDDSALQPFVGAAVCIVTAAASCMTSKGVTPACQDIVADWLGAHLMAMTTVGEKTGVKKSERFEGYSVQYVVGGFSGKGVLSTTYGQTANSLSGGCLQEADKSPLLISFFG